MNAHSTSPVTGLAAPDPGLKAPDSGLRICLSFTLVLALIGFGSVAAAQTADEIDYAKRWKHLSNETAKEHRMAGRFCRDRKLWAAARSEWLRSLELEPENEEANKALGRVKKGGAWTDDPAAAPPAANAGAPKDIEEALGIYRKKRGTLDAAAARGFAELADWADRRGLDEEARALRAHLHEYDPQDAAAAEAVG